MGCVMSVVCVLLLITTTFINLNKEGITLLANLGTRVTLVITMILM